MSKTDNPDKALSVESEGNGKNNFKVSEEDLKIAQTKFTEIKSKIQRNNAKNPLPSPSPSQITPNSSYQGFNISNKNSPQQQGGHNKKKSLRKRSLRKRSLRKRSLRKRSLRKRSLRKRSLRKVSSQYKQKYGGKRKSKVGRKIKNKN